MSGYLLIPVAIGQLEGQRDADAAFRTFQQISSIAERFGDVDLATIGRLGRGEALIALGERDRGIRLLDEAMAGVTAGEVSPSVAGMVYCATIEDCYAMFDIRRAQEWTTALTEWCAAHPDLVFRGRCLIFRAELMRFHGDWATAADEVQRARLALSGPPVNPAIGEAHYEEAELHRLQGRFDEAERAYAQGSGFGRRPEPGLALLRLAQGRAVPARNMIARALEELPDDPRLLEAAVTIALGRGDAAEARSFVDRLQPSAGSGVPTLLEAVTARAEGEVLLAEGKPREALRALRTAFGLWQQLDAPYDAARVRVAIARACRALGDDETAELETAAARRVFEALGAAPALADLDGGRRRQPRPQSARARGAAPPRRRANQSRDRRPARDQRADRGPAREQPVHEARRVDARGRHGVGLRARPRLSTHSGRVIDWVLPRMRQHVAHS